MTSKQYDKSKLIQKLRGMSIVQLALILLLILATCPQGKAQFDSAAVIGNIKDPSGANLSSASVRLASVAKGTTVIRQTDPNGAYEFDNVQPGEYTLSATAQGFEISTTEKFTVNVGARQRVDLALKVGTQNENVTVSGAAALLETDTSDRGQTVQGAEAVALPLNGRAYADLSILVPGVQKSLLALPNTGAPGRDASYNTNGLTSQYNNFNL
ncbi:MAG TPA: carboxypeptidase-like regulatory domain-containing protein, partial [Edaphobacter sp.]|nr:carboxypeptidase-like regulatory domain-containing protein [Edaphobacter sp.]